MSRMRIKYSLSQARKNMCRNGLMTAASLFTIASCLVILGVFTILTMNIGALTSQVQESCEIQLFLKTGTAQVRVEQIKEEILATENVREAVLFTKEDMLSYVKEDLFSEREELLEGLDGENNPFSDSYKITLDNIAFSQETSEKLQKLSDVDHVVNEESVVNTVLTYSSIIRKISIGIMALLLLISIVIISNTVKLTVFNRRKEINIMKYIGATDYFIRVPFVFEGLLIGLVGAGIAFGLMSWGYIALYGFAKEIGFEVFDLITYPELAPVLGILFVCVGCLIGVAGSGLSMKKYLRV